MLTLTEALMEERQRRQFAYKEGTLQQQMAHEVLRALGERLAAADLPRWHFIANGDEIAVLYHPHGSGTRERIGAWYVDEEMRLSFGEEKLEWITAESWQRVIDKAVVLSAAIILDREARVIAFEPGLGGRFGDEHLQRQPERAS